ncbi:MAG: hypothetical protein B6D59_06410, partial [Campylobacteraceae bacterium 4484_4]
SDIVEIARAGQSSPMLGFKKPFLGENLYLGAKEEIESRYYLRMRVEDKPGVLAKIAKILGNMHISIDTFLQKPSHHDQSATLLCATHTCKEREIRDAVNEIEDLEVVKAPLSIIRIET